VLTEGDLERLGATAKCAPPLRSGAEQAELWARLLANEVELVASDHSPAPADLKAEGETGFLGVWGGIAGVQSTLELLLAEGYHARGLALSAIAALVATNPAERFGLAPPKGALLPGADADVALLRLDERWRLEREQLRDRHRLSPYVGRVMRGRVVRTIRRGTTIARDGEALPGAGGRLLRPHRG
jgi:allantoinase